MSTLKCSPVVPSCMVAGKYPLPSVHCVEPLKPARGVLSSELVTHIMSCRCLDDPESRTLQSLSDWLWYAVSSDRNQSFVLESMLSRHDARASGVSAS